MKDPAHKTLGLQPDRDGRALAIELLGRTKHTRSSSTYALKGGGFLHIDRHILAIEIPKVRKRKQPNAELRRADQCGFKYTAL